MDEVFGIVIVIAVLFGVFCAWGPKAMLAVIAVPVLLWVAVIVWLTMGDIGGRNHANSASDWVEVKRK
jgi:hypothetical protein